ncbi:MAG: hypothetical protein GY784_18255, partial [Gammaproteobacteria bacterium]|nr:hypothetical protein [Gammaproteobacteria bacterium]
MENPVFLIALIVGSIILLSVCFVYIRHQVLPLGGIALSLIGMILMGLSVWKSVDISIDDSGIHAKLDQIVLVANQAQEDASEAQRVSQQSLQEIGTVKVQTEKTIQAS